MKYSKVQMSNQNNIEFKKEATNCNEEPTNKPFDKSFRQPIRLVRQNLSNHGLLNLTTIFKGDIVLFTTTNVTFMLAPLCQDPLPLLQFQTNSMQHLCDALD